MSRDEAIHVLLYAPQFISATGKSRLIALLQLELSGQASKPGPMEDDEAYPQYISSLTHLVERYNDPAATAVLAQQAIAFSMNSRFQVAASGDAGIAPLVSAWDANPNLRFAVVSTLGLAIGFADSTARPLTSANRETAVGLVLLAYADPDAPLRRAFVSAAQAMQFPTFVPLLQQLVASDPAAVDGRRYIASAAEALLPSLVARRTAASSAELTQELATEVAAACAIGWISDPALCTSLPGYLAGPTPDIGAFQVGVRTPSGLTPAAQLLFNANGDFVAARETTTAGMVLTYICGNRFRVRNPNGVLVPVRYDVYNTTDSATVELPPKPVGAAYSQTFFTTAVTGTVRLFYNGTLIQTKANGGKPCP